MSNNERELDRLHRFLQELKQALVSNPNQAVPGYGSVKGAISNVEREIHAREADAAKALEYSSQKNRLHFTSRRK